ncbi:STAS domain-containing protein [Allorhizocola rhizosphaerae]|uniref:STAS domain-containing protein n=1 Tax=Allorhizocola rhizosphaerae TaxID=1872709 RepID=UPI000E3C46D6|nr:STAS domain-containing protein [Allorhizocola rhizosphaerae]
MSTRWAIGPVIRRADIPALCDRLDALLQSGDCDVECDVSTLTEPDMATVEALLRLHLTARRRGRRVRFHRPGSRLMELIVMTGLALVLVPALGEPSYEAPALGEPCHQAREVPPPGESCHQAREVPPPGESCHQAREVPPPDEPCHQVRDGPAQREGPS